MSKKIQGSYITKKEWGPSLFSFPSLGRTPWLCIDSCFYLSFLVV